MSTILTVIKKINKTAAFLYFIGILSSCRDKNIINTFNSGELPSCRYLNSLNESKKNFCNLLYTVDEIVDTNLIKPSLSKFSFRLIYNVADGNSYIIKLEEKDSIGLLSIKQFPYQELNYDKYCIDGFVEYTCKSIKLKKEQINLVKAHFESLKRILIFNDNKHIGFISLEVIQNDKYEFGFTVEKKDEVKKIIEAILKYVNG